MPRKKPVVEIILEVSNKVAKSSIKATSTVVGFYCEVFFPQAPEPNGIPRVFGFDGEDSVYSIVPTRKGKYITLGLFGDNFHPVEETGIGKTAQGATFDPYGGSNPYILTHKDEKFPVQTKVKIYRGKEKHIMKVQDHEVFPSVKGQIYFKNMLVPFN